MEHQEGTKNINIQNMALKHKAYIKLYRKEDSLNVIHVRIID